MVMTSIRQRILPATRGHGFQLDGYWVWCNSVAQADDGQWHAFASIVPKTVPFGLCWLTHSEIAHAVADNPEGPYRLHDRPFVNREPTAFDGRMMHNPAIRRHGKSWLLYYIGVGGADWINSSRDIIDGPHAGERRYDLWQRKRIGLAWADSPFGPWQRSPQPILEPRPGKWDAIATSNPAPIIAADGGVLLIYKSRLPPKPDGSRNNFRLGLARAAHWRGPYERALDEPILRPAHPDTHIEDPCVWSENGRFHLIFKDCNGTLSGRKGDGVYAWSDDGQQWNLTPERESSGWSRDILWTDGTRQVLGSFERPQFIMQNGRPTHLIAAVADGPGGFSKAQNTWSQIFPLMLA